MIDCHMHQTVKMGLVCPSTVTIFALGASVLRGIGNLQQSIHLIRLNASCLYMETARDLILPIRNALDMAWTHIPAQLEEPVLKQALLWLAGRGMEKIAVRCCWAVL